MLSASGRFGFVRSRRVILLACPLFHLAIGPRFVAIGPGGFAPCWLSIGRPS